MANKHAVTAGSNMLKQESEAGQRLSQQGIAKREIDDDSRSLKQHCKRLKRSAYSCSDDISKYMLPLMLLESKKAIGIKSNSLGAQVDGGNIIRVILDVLRRYPQDIALQYLGIECMRILSRDPKKRSQFAGEFDVISVILRILQTHLSDSRLQERGLSLLSYLAEDSKCRAAFIREGGLLVLLMAMKYHSDDPCIQCNGTATLCWISHLHQSRERNSIIVVKDDVIETILSTMRRFSGNPSIFGNCICTLSGLRTRASINNKEIGGFQTVLQIQAGMKQHLQISKVQRNCLMLLRLMRGDEQQNEFFRSEQDYVDSILAAMKEHPDESEIQSQGCTALVSLLCLKPSTASVMSACGCIDVVLSTQKRHPNTLQIQQASWLFMHTMLQNGNEDSTAAFGGCAEVIDIIMKSSS